MSERKEVLKRIVVGVVTGVILYLWSFAVGFIVLLHIVYAIFANKRHRGMAEFCNLWLTQSYKYSRYMIFATNQTPFPFSQMSKPMEQVDIASKKSK